MSLALLRDLRQLWKQRYWRAAIILVAVAAVAVAAMGGFATAASKKGRPPVAKVGQRLTTGAFAITPLCAWTDDLRPGQPEIMRGQKRYLMLRARVENLGDDWLAMSAYLTEDVVRLDEGGDTGQRSNSMQRVDDHSFNVKLQPRLPVLLDLIWEQAEGKPVPAEVPWGIYLRRHVERGYLAGDEFWVQNGAGFRLPMKLTAPCGDPAA